MCPQFAKLGVECFPYLFLVRCVAATREWTVVVQSEAHGTDAIRTVSLATRIPQADR